MFLLCKYNQIVFIRKKFFVLSTKKRTFTPENITPPMSKKNKNKKKTELPLTPPPHPAVIRAQELAAAEAKIRDENLRVAEERRNLKQCPDCGAPYPLVSNICPHCGHVLHEQQGAEYNIRTLIDNINASIDTLKNAPQPTFLQALTYRFDIVLLYFIVAAILVFTHYDYVHSLFTDGFYYNISESNVISERTSYLLIIFRVVLFIIVIYGFYAWGIKKQKISPLQLSDDEFYKARHANEKYIRQVATIYGDNPEAKELLNKFAAEIEAVQKKRNANQLKIILLIIGLMLIPLMFYVMGPSERTEYQRIRSEHPIPFQMSAFHKTLKPLPENPVAEDIADRIKTDGEADLMFDIDTVINYNTNFDSVAYRIRIDRANIVYIGEKKEVPDTIFLKARLYDKNKNPLVDSLLMFRRFKVIDPDEPLIEYIMPFGKGHYHQSFYSKEQYFSAEYLRNIADSAYYFSIF